MEKLRLALNGRVAPGQLTEHLEYYEDYINTEIRKGKPEEEVLSELGDPRLIARTIAQTESGGDEEAGARQGAGRGRRFRDPAGQGRGGLVFRIPSWVWLILGLLMVVVILSAIFSAIAALLPILLPILVVLFLVKAFRDWLN